MVVVVVVMFAPLRRHHQAIIATTHTHTHTQTLMTSLNLHQTEHASWCDFCWHSYAGVVQFTCLWLPTLVCVVAVVTVTHSATAVVATTGASPIMDQKPALPYRIDPELLDV